MRTEVGVLLVKNARRAVEDGDHIYSILRGIDINNDGSEKVGFYAPGIKGQRDVINKVLERTEINPETIEYVEAHGTGTKLGDPIEVRALRSVYEKYTSRQKYCGLGSVKTNIGHQDTAAGIAGCMKVVLSLYHKCLPKTLNYNQANEEIDFEHSPFYVVEKTTPLSDRDMPHRAALSSFGIGGTNAHAIFESSIAYINDDAAVSSKYIVPISAKNKKRLREYVHSLSAYINEHQETIKLRDIAYTFQIGRVAMEERIAFYVKNIKELIHEMEQYLVGKQTIKNGYIGQGKKDLVSEALIKK